MNLMAKAEVRSFLWKQQRGKCFYCEQMMILGKPWDSPRRATIDHIKPSSQGGSSKLTNLCLCCASCNNLKADMSREEFEITLGLLKMGLEYATVGV